MRPGHEASTEALLAFAGELLGPELAPTALLGRGAAGFVVAARDRAHGEVAVKIAYREAMDAQGLARLEREREVRARVGDEGVVRVHRVDAARGVLVMERVDGGTLADRLARGERLAPAEARALAAQLLGTLARCHAAGVVHRDIKPANLLLGAGGRALLADFGVARVGRGDLTAAGVTLGTRAYMAPEQLRRADVDGRADLYALGATLFEAITGEPLHTEERSIERPAEVVVAATHDAGLAAAIGAATAVRPEDRPSSAEAMWALLERAPGAAEGSASPASPAPPASAAPAARPASADAVAGPALAAPDASAAPLRPPAPVVPPAHDAPRAAERMHRPRPIAAIAAVAVGLVGVTAGASWLGRSGDARAPRTGTRLAMLPFEERTGRPELRALAGELPSLLGERVSAARPELVIGYHTLLRRVGTASASPERWRAAALEEGARYAFVAATSTADHDRVALEGRVVDAASGAVVQRLTAVVREAEVSEALMTWAVQLQVPQVPSGNDAAGVALARGRAALEREDFATAVTALMEAVRLDEGSTDAWFHLAVAAWWHELEKRQVESIIERALAVGQPPAHADFLRGVRLFVHGDYARAAELFEAAVGARPAEPYLVYGLGEALFHSSRTDEGVERIVQALRLAPGQRLGLIHVLNHAIMREDQARLRWGLAKVAGERPWDALWRARLHLALDERPAAEAELVLLLTRTATELEYVMATEMLAALEVLDGRPAAADRRVQQLEEKVSSAAYVVDLRCALHTAEGGREPACGAVRQRLAAFAETDPALALNAALTDLEIELLEGERQDVAWIDGLIERFGSDERAPADRVALARVIARARLGGEPSAQELASKLRSVADARRALSLTEHDPRGAAEAWRQAALGLTDPRYHAIIAVLRARALLAAGDAEAAIEACRPVSAPTSVGMPWLAAVGSCDALVARAEHALGRSAAARRTRDALARRRTRAPAGDPWLAGLDRALR